MLIEVVDDAAGFARLAPEWEALRARSGLKGPFNGFGWSWEWWRALGGGRALRLVVAKAAGEVVGILPMFEELRGGAKTLAFIGSAGGGSDYLDVVTADDAVRKALLEFAVRVFRPDVVALDDLDAGSPTLVVVREIVEKAGGTILEEDRYPCPYIPIASDWKTFLAGASRKDNLKRREKWFAAQPGFRITCETDAAAVPAFLQRFHRLHAARWHEDGGSQAFADGRLVRFHERVCERFADEGRLRLWTMWVAGEAIAVAYAFDDGKRSLYYQSGFLPAWGAKSAGLVLLARFIQDAFDRGLEEIDFLRGNESYKWEWTDKARRTVRQTWCVTEGGRRSIERAQLTAAVRGKVRGLLPERVRTEVARVVRGARLRAAM